MRLIPNNSYRNLHCSLNEIPLWRGGKGGRGISLVHSLSQEHNQIIPFHAVLNRGHTNSCYRLAKCSLGTGAVTVQTRGAVSITTRLCPKHHLYDTNKTTRLNTHGLYTETERIIHVSKLGTKNYEDIFMMFCISIPLQTCTAT